MREDGTPFRGPAFLDGAWRKVECSEHADHYHLQVEDDSPLRIDATGVVQRGGEPPASTHGLATARILSLALRGAFCLHASAVARGREIFAFTGSSGAGKSTLARLLAAHGWRLEADDMLAVTGVEDDPSGASAFAPAILHAVPSSALRLSRVYVLGSESPAVAVRPLAGLERTKAIIRHTVAARLFGPRLLARHLGFCARLAARVPVVELQYPRRLDVAASVAELLRAA